MTSTNPQRERPSKLIAEVGQALRDWNIRFFTPHQLIALMLLNGKEEMALMESVGVIKALLARGDVTYLKAGVYQHAHFDIKHKEACRKGGEYREDY